MADVGMRVPDEDGDEITIPFSKILYIRRPAAGSPGLPERLKGKEAIAIILHDPMGRSIWVVGKDDVDKAVSCYEAWLKKGAP